MKKGIMKRTIKLLGTQLELLKGQHVLLCEATNIPGGGYYATPVGGLWPEPAPKQSGDTYVLIRAADVPNDVEITE